MITEYSMAQIEAFAARFYNGRELLLTPYAYNAEFTAFATGVLSSQITIAANADFFILGIDYVAFDDTWANIAQPPVKILFTDTGSNEQFTNQAVPLVNYAGNSTVNKNLPYPRIVSGRSSLTVNVENLGDDTIELLNVQLSGVLVRAYSA